MNPRQETDAYIYEEVLRNSRYLVVALDADGRIRDVDCPGRAWSLDALTPGQLLPDALASIVASVPPDRAVQLFPMVHLSDTRVADVHVLRQDDGLRLILHDVRETHDAKRALQQKAHEIALLLERQAALNEALDRKRAEAERLSEAKTRFIASMSHEFRSPITSILGHVDLLAQQAADGDSPAAIRRAAWHLLALVENLLEQARQEEGTTQLNPAPVDLDGVLESLRALFGVQATARGLELEIDGPAAPVRLETDELRLRQVLINLLGNAIRYTEAGRVALAAAADGDRLTFRVSDTGPGIEPADQARIFEPFARLDPERGAGAGLGLTISRQLVQAMGGDLALDSVPGRGAEFSFSLALAAEPRTAAASHLPGRTALVVDDDADILALFELLLDDWGMKVLRASTVGEALAVAASRDVDLVLTDYHLEDGNGLELLEALKERDYGARRVLCSGAGVAADDDPRLRRLADELLAKPVQPDRLRAVLERALDPVRGRAGEEERGPEFEPGSDAGGGPSSDPSDDPSSDSSSNLGRDEESAAAP